MPKQQLATVLALFFGISLSAVLFLVAVAWENDRDRADFEGEASTLASLLRTSLARDEEVLMSIASLNAVTEDVPVKREEFRAFVAGALSRSYYTQAFGWVPRVPESRRAGLEQAARQEGYPYFQFEQRSPDGRLIQAPRRDEYYPLYFVEPAGGGGLSLGFDLSSSPEITSALEAARDTGRPSASVPVLLPGVPRHTNLLVFVPIYRGPVPSTIDQRRERLNGFALAVFRIDDLVENSLGSVANPIRLYDDMGPGETSLLYASGIDPEGPSGSRFVDQSELPVSGRLWRLVIGSKPEEHVAQLFSGSAILLAAGFALTLVLTSYVNMAVGRAGDLLRANASLENEIAERRRAEKELRRANRALRTLSNSHDVLVRASDEAQLARSICRIAIEIGGYATAWIGFAEQDDGKTVSVVARINTSEADSAPPRVSWGDDEWGQGPGGTAIRTGSPQIYRYVSEDPRTLPWRDSLLRHGVAALISLPFMRGDVAFGVLTIAAREAASFDEEEVELLSELASATAYGILALRSEVAREEADRRLRSSLERLEAVVSGVIRAIAVTTELRDPYTAGHQQRVSQLAQAIAVEMKLSQFQVDEVRIAGEIHDIGKISVPAELLSKPGKLNEMEFAILKDHSRSGYEILKEIDFPWPIADIVLQHHEMLDGSGYPNGLRGEEILRGARIIAVADIVEAMTSHRPYRPSLGLETALGEIEAARGNRYDPEAVDACVRLFRENRFRFG
ncbi:MAG TPA: CHASE domain-containing protein [Chloroflexota bacterium]